MIQKQKNKLKKIRNFDWREVKNPFKDVFESIFASTPTSEFF